MPHNSLTRYLSEQAIKREMMKNRPDILDKSYNEALMLCTVPLVHLDVSRATYNTWVMPLIRTLTRLTFWTDSPLVRDCAARHLEPILKLLYSCGGDIQKVFDTDNGMFVGVFIGGLAEELEANGLENVAYDITRPFLPTSQLNKTFELFTKVNPVTSSGQMFAFGYISDVLVSNNLSAEAKTRFLTELAKPLLYPKGNQNND